MSNETKEVLYNPDNDPDYKDYYIDEEGWRDTPVRCYFVHGGFRATEYQGQHVKFCFYFPEKEKYEGRFYQYLSPAPEDERESEKAKGVDDRITFALTHGAYYVVSNQGGFVFPMGPRCYQANAASAQLSRKFAVEVYGYEHRPYGYCYGGSGGSFKTMGAIECTEGIWDGAVPYVLANPMATPNVFCPRMRVMRTLGEAGLAKLVDRMDVGGSGDLYEGLDDSQKEALEEATKMGFPKRGWFSYKTMGDGALSVLMPTVYQVYPDYFKDFWEKPGFAGTDNNSSEAKDRIQFVTKVSELIPRKRPTPEAEDGALSVDNSWISTMVGNQNTPDIRMEELPPENAYLFHCRLRVLSGECKGIEVPVESIEDGVIRVSSAFDGENKDDVLKGIVVGDEIMVDNSDYLAIQTFQRHQIPDESYKVYDQYRNPDKSPKYPQLSMLIAPIIAQGGAGTVPKGNIHCKTIALCSLLDESAFAWHGDWYRQAVIRSRGNEDDFRLYYNDNCIHDDSSNLEEPQHQICYLGIRYQALIDVANWVEKGIEPCQTTKFKFEDGQIEVPATAKERCGMQPVVDAFANGQKCIHVSAGQEINFEATIEVPENAGKVSSAAWDFEAKDDFTNYLPLEKTADGTAAKVKASHIFTKAGTYFPTIKVASSRDGKTDDIFTQCQNLDRVRVIVED